MSGKRHDFVRQAGLGAISGLRSMSGPASVARAAREGRIPLEGTRLAFLASPSVARALTVLQAGEMVGDKLPFAPSRTGPLPLLGRAGSGALVGAAVSLSGGRRPLAGALVGAGAAVAAVFAGDRLRGAIVGGTDLPDPVFGAAEDAVVLVGSAGLLRGA